jgi:16S rRNA (uracil1498-N3)-methyltransferase
MRLARIYYEGKLGIELLITLPQDTSHYLLHVLRLKVGSAVLLFNGEGGQYLGTIADIGKKRVLVNVAQFQPLKTESSCNIHLAQALGKGEKMDWVIQKAVEVGISEITPLLTEFCNVKLDESRADKRWSHWQNIMISACEQSGRATLPKLNPIIQYKHWLPKMNSSLKLICHPTCGSSLNSLAPSRDITVLIGPEGGWSEDELTLALQEGFVGVALGPRILRMETAAVVAVALLQAKFGDLM